MIRLTFHGGAGTVTGSKHLLETEGGTLLVDCGLFQGHKELRERNWSSPGFEPGAVDALALTHAHIDHSGWIPRLVQQGFRGPVFATPATADLADVMLRDSARIQEEDAERANRRGYSRHRPALPLYTSEDAERALRRFEVVDYGSWQAPFDGLRFRFTPIGHIVGSGMVEVELREGARELRVLFSGDVGRYGAPLVKDPTAPPSCDVLVVESTYGDREHPELALEEQLAGLLREIAESRGTALVSAFAVGRSQQLMFLLNRVMEAHPALAVPIHLDSPMAIDATKIYGRYPEESGLEELDLRPGSSRVFGRDVFLHRTVEESKRLNDLPGPRVIVSSSGMMTAGRVLHHLARLLPDERNRIVIAGYQAPGTRGWRIEHGEEFVRVHGHDVRVRAGRVKISGLSAHADRRQLLHWLRDLPPPTRTFVVHGDDRAPQELARALREQLGFRCDTPGLGASFEL